MSIASLIERVVGKQRKREAARAADFRHLVAEVVDGCEPDADHVEAILRDAGKSLDDLREAAERLAHRRRLREQWDRLPELAAERTEIEAKIAAADAALDEAEQRHTDVTGPLHFRLRQGRDAMMEADAVKRQLHDTCTDAALLAELRDVLARLSATDREATECRDAARAERDRALVARSAVERAKRILGGEDQVEEHQARVKEYERKAAGFDAQLAKIEKRLAGLQKEEAAIRERMLVP